MVSLEKAPDALHKNAGQVGIGDAMYVIYIYDETEIVHYIRENYDQRVNVGLLYIDNYDESLANVDDVRRSLLAAMVDRKINKYMLSIDAITRKIEKDKYIFLFQHKYLSKLQADKFSLLDDIRSINVGNDTSITISMGIGIQANTYRKRQEYARSAIDLHLPAVVIRLSLRQKTIYFIMVEKVFSRKKIHALKPA